MKRILYLFFLLLFLIEVISSGTVIKAESIESADACLDEIDMKNIESWINKCMESGKIPGLSVAIVHGGDTVYSQGFGYADIETKTAVTSDTLFELASNSKAFTGLGILILADKEMLSLSDSVEKYLPWFKMKYSGKYRGQTVDGYVDITLEQLLHHTSGIPFESIGDIPKSESENALEEAVRIQVDKDLEFYPGERFQYTSMNYDILGLVIEKVSGKTFEEFIEDNILTPLNLDDTYVGTEDVPVDKMAKGYKVGFLKAREYTAPEYGGNTPSAYIISDINDMAEWMKVQTGTKTAGIFDEHLISLSQTPNRRISPEADGSCYAAGWFVYQGTGGIIVHGGNNPNYSSYITISSDEDYGVAVLANINSEYTQVVGQGILDMLIKADNSYNTSDAYCSLDIVCVVIMCAALPFTLITLIFFIRLINQIRRKQRKYDGNVRNIAVKSLLLIIFWGIAGTGIYNIPVLLFGELPWSFVTVWGPVSLIPAVIALSVSIFVFSMYYFIASLFSKSAEKLLFPIIVISVVSGFGNAMIIFVVNMALINVRNMNSYLVLYFALGILMYVIGQKIVRAQLISLTNQLVFQKRSELIEKILKSSFQSIETIEKEKILTALINDTETISNSINTVIFGVTSLITLVCCFVYLGIISIYGLLISIFVILLAAGSYYIAGNHANALWEETRDIQNTFFRFIDQMINGFKELSIYGNRKKEFKEDLLHSCDIYCEKRMEGDMSFTAVFLIGELLFTSVIGVVAFVFPIVFKNIEAGTLQTYVFIFLYMTSPVHGVLDSIPIFIRSKISYKRLTELLELLELKGQIDNGESDIEKMEGFPKNIQLELQEVEFKYKNEGGERFKVGPVNLKMETGEIVFITGGNGSGKSTLAKILTGLYSPDSGKIMLNGEPVEAEVLKQCFSTVFSDYYLFEKLYGINADSKRQDIQYYLEKLKIDEKVQINGRDLSTIKLSVGQRKRLALLICCIEERPIYLFDEWAAEQDPEFRHYFYHTLLKEFKNQGKLVIAITHDDRYFNVSDRVIKLEFGKVTDYSY